MQGLRTLTGDELTHMHAVQVSVPSTAEFALSAVDTPPLSCSYLSLKSNRTSESVLHQPPP